MELPLLVSSRQCAALEKAAQRQGLTIGQLLRRLIAAHLAEPDAGLPAKWNPAERA